jgi:hypothetical protein
VVGWSRTSSHPRGAPEANLVQLIDSRHGTAIHSRHAYGTLPTH